MAGVVAVFDGGGEVGVVVRDCVAVAAEFVAGEVVAMVMALVAEVVVVDVSGGGSMADTAAIFVGPICEATYQIITLVFAARNHKTRCNSSQFSTHTNSCQLNTSHAISSSKMLPLL